MRVARTVAPASSISRLLPNGKPASETSAFVNRESSSRDVGPMTP